MGRLFNTDQQSNSSGGGRIFGGQTDTEALLANITQTKDSITKLNAEEERKRLAEEARKKAEADAKNPLNIAGRIFGDLAKNANQFIGDAISPDGGKLQAEIRKNQSKGDAALAKAVAEGKMTAEKAAEVKASIGNVLDTRLTSQATRALQSPIDLVQQVRVAAEGGRTAPQGGAALTDPTLVKNQIDYINSEAAKGTISKDKAAKLVADLQTKATSAQEKLANAETNVGVKYDPSVGAFAALDTASLLTGAGLVRLPSTVAKQVAGKTAAKEVVQVVDKTTGEKTFYRIPASERDTIVKQVDGTQSGVAGKDINGAITHITARSPEDMLKRGFTDGGTITSKDIPTTVEAAPTLKTSGSAQKLVNAVAEKTGVELGDAAQYGSLSYKDEAAKALTLVETDPQAAKNIALGRAPADNPVHEVSVKNALIDKSLKEGDYATLQELANSATNTKISEAAQTLGAEGYSAVDGINPVKNMQALRDARIQAVAKRSKKSPDQLVQSTTEKIAKSIPSVTKDDWSMFVKQLECK